MGSNKEADIKPLTDEQRERLIKIGTAADGTIITAINGLSVIGRLLNGIGDREQMSGKLRSGCLDNQSLLDLGYFIEGLADLVNMLTATATDIAYITAQQTWLKAASPLIGIKPPSEDQEVQS